MTALEMWKASLPDGAPSAIPAGKHLRLVIPGAPRTKKNSPQLFRNITDAFLRDLIMDVMGELDEMNQRFPRRADFPQLISSPEDLADRLAQDRSGFKERLFEHLKNRDTQFPRPNLVPSAAYLEWHRESFKAMLPTLETLRPYFPITYPVHLHCRIYREADRGDQTGYKDAIADFLEDIGVLENDVLIKSWDGTRALKDAARPRVEIWIAAHSVESDEGLFQKSPAEWTAHEEPIPTEAECIVPEPERDGARLALITRYSQGRR